MQRAGRDVGKVLQRYLFTVTAEDEKTHNMLVTYTVSLSLPSQMTAFVKLWRYLCPTSSTNFSQLQGRGRDRE